MDALQATQIAAASNRRLGPKVAELFADRDGLLPVWIRPPSKGQEHYTSLTAGTLRNWAKAGRIKSVTIREQYRQRGTTLYDLASILSYLEQKATQ